MKTLTKDQLKATIGKKSLWNPKQTVNMFHYIAGIEGFDEKLSDTNTFKAPNIADFQVYSDGLAIKMMNKFKLSYAGIPNDKISRITLENSEQIYERKEKSVIGRAIIGGLLFGPVGATVGGLSGLKDGQKKVKMPDLMLSIEIGQENEIDRVLLFSTKFKNKEAVVKFFELYYPDRFELAD